MEWLCHITVQQVPEVSLSVSFRFAPLEEFWDCLFDYAIYEDCFKFIHLTSANGL